MNSFQRASEAFELSARRREVHDRVVHEVDAEPLAWRLTMLGYDGYALRVWFEPIEDEE